MGTLDVGVLDVGRSDVAPAGGSRGPAHERLDHVEHDRMMRILCLLGFHKFPPDEEEEAAKSLDIFAYLLQRCVRCGKKRRDTGGPLGSPRA